MINKKITISLQQIKLFGAGIILIFLSFIAFALIEGNHTAKASDPPEKTGTATPFLPSADQTSLTLAAPTLANNLNSIPTAINTNPTDLPAALPTLPNISPFSLPEGINPLTGLPPAAPENLQRRPIASKITLYPRSVRPESSLTLADVVFEYYIEAGLTRFIAVFYGNDSKQVGPVRSGRFFDEHIARMYQAYLVFKYADPRVYNHLKSTNINKFLIVPGVTACPPFFVAKNHPGRDTYNNVFFDTTRFAACLEKQGKDNSPPDLRASYFSQTPPPYSEPALSIFARYSVDDYHYWGYNETNHKYYRYQEMNDTRDGKFANYLPLIDEVNGHQVSTDNLVYLFVLHRFEDKYQEEDEVYHIDLIGSGKAYLFRDGVVLPAYWQRTDLNQPLLLTDPNGMPISLKPGTTFYEVLGKASTVADQNAQWRFQFKTP